MLFNSISFLLFFPAVYGAYLVLNKNHRAQNYLLLAANLFFYGFWNWRFLALLGAVILVSFYSAELIARAGDERRRKLLMAFCALACLGVLGFFKYFNFFASSFAGLLEIFGLHPGSFVLNILLPVGISFYTFQALGYTIDVYRKRIEPHHSLVEYALFVSFFPLILAGPIERAGNILRQIAAPRKITAAGVDSALFLILWGYFKKVVVADNLAIIANRIFDGYTQYEGLDLVIGALAFTFQIYCDFSGYSDIARGLARLMGFELMLNFRLPYFAADPREFWRRWHISLSSWLRDYLYISLGGSRGGAARTYVNLFITMMLCGLWHGAAWTFVFWGAYHGFFLILYRLFERGSGRSSSGAGAILKNFVGIAVMFVIAAAGWVFFRSHTLGQAFYILGHAGFSVSPHTAGAAHDLVFFCAPLIVIQLWQAATNNLLAPAKLHPVLKAPFYALLLFAIVVFGVRESVEFIYFQF